ncbi:MAG TPA: MFS transporter [Candidatus Binatia bacterium]|jgi:MFS family permease
MPNKLPFAASLGRSLRHRNYRLYLTGQLISVCGTWMQQVALAWLVYRLTGSATLLGAVGFASQIPIFALSPIGGVISDRFSCHRILLVTQSLALFQALLLAVLTLTGRIEVAHLILLGAVLGVVNAFDMPARQSLVNQLVGPEDLSNAIALNSSMINVARIVGPGLAGLLVAKWGEGFCFLVNALSYLAVLWALLAMKLPERRREADHQLSMTRSLIEGTRYIARTRPIRALLALLGVTGLFGMTYMTLMPIFAAKIHGGGADVMGLMLGAVGLGALAGALFLARRVELRGLGRIIMVTTIGFGFGLVVFSASHLFWLSLVILLGVGFCWMVLIAACNTVLQALAEDEMRGRVMSVFSMMLVGMAPFGSLIGGWLADRIGAPLVVAIGGLFCAVAGALFAWQLPSLREAALPILIARGMIPDPLNPISEVAVMARPGAPR